mmetsp:Transcript_35900/g.113560  ORF Transcript_35900/g.113560 Transcript_35900/m.113560 type:complete len:200 (+) Transcript_35900:579-1178(+)
MAKALETAISRFHWGFGHHLLYNATDLSLSSTMPLHKFSGHSTQLCGGPWWCGSTRRAPPSSFPSLVFTSEKHPPTPWCAKIFSMNMELASLTITISTPAAAMARTTRSIARSTGTSLSASTMSRSLLPLRKAAIITLSMRVVQGVCAASKVRNSASTPSSRTTTVSLFSFTRVQSKSNTTRGRCVGSAMMWGPLARRL